MKNYQFLRRHSEEGNQLLRRLLVTQIKTLFSSKASTKASRSALISLFEHTWFCLHSLLELSNQRRHVARIVFIGLFWTEGYSGVPNDDKMTPRKAETF